ncbi:MAG: ABC transporter ATP-binding protein [Pseudomonadota bacterium]
MIELSGIKRIFHVGEETVYALREVDLTISRGEYVAVMGSSGSGKSTLLNIMGLLDRPDEGVYRLDNIDTTCLADDEQASVRCYKIGFVFQFFHLIPRLTAADNVALPMALAGVDPADRRARVEAALSLLGLSNRAKHRPDQLSGGQRQRVAIARAIVMTPQVILADEPTGNLDRASSMEVIQSLEALQEKGLTLIMVTHDPELGKRASRQIKMLDGKIVEKSHVS